MIGASHNSIVWSLQARLAHCLVNPLGFTHDDHLGDMGIPLDVVRRFSAHEDFSGPLNKHVARELGLLDLTPKCSSLAMMSDQSKARLASTLVSQSAADFGVLLRITAIARLHKSISGLMLKSHCQRIEALFGEDAFDIAIREVAFFHACLGYESDEDQVFLCICNGEEAEALQAVTLAGAEGLLAFVCAVDPGLEPLIRLRVSKDLNESLSTRLRVMNGEQQDHYVQYLRRRMPQWRAFID
ncbi:hypothetical protein [Pseudovibrio sp. Tun.PSC04-5.I4]|uniref:hypothetical protein n=1 Tax=Pseudovibrio sp. Tun.PSC04-5.I4 TaxID=1798213 RepID=UPI0008905412|nr:hypothetical protein [Pseudovibrio sp. Tun.PSC04-5.I4]SDR14762.1 hypothetical protein SAMN04515695_3015 [Pseudovibrio sp. Tun.PSC04-5.I4]